MMEPVEVELAEQEAYPRALARAIRLLTRREHSEQEIRNKLHEEYAPAVIESVIRVCRERNWLNEERLLAMVIRSRAARGYGPRRLYQELRLKGIAAEQIKSALEASECDWFAVAREQARRKSADPASLDRTGLAKLMNYLQRRGFSVEQARYACRPTDDAAAES